MKICILLCCLFSWENEYSKALKILKDLYHSDKWLEDKKGRQWVIKKSLIEMIVHSELGNTEFVLSRIISFRKRYRELLIGLEENRVLKYVNLLEKMAKENTEILHPLFKEMEIDFNSNYSKNEDIFVLTFYVWMKSKIEGKGFYEELMKVVEE